MGSASYPEKWGDSIIILTELLCEQTESTSTGRTRGAGRAAAPPPQLPGPERDEEANLPALGTPRGGGMGRGETFKDMLGPCISECEPQARCHSFFFFFEFYLFFIQQVLISYLFYTY